LKIEECSSTCWEVSSNLPRNPVHQSARVVQLAIKSSEQLAIKSSKLSNPTSQQAPSKPATIIKPNSNHQAFPQLVKKMNNPSAIPRHRFC
jgi:hypothetical protein